MPSSVEFRSPRDEWLPLHRACRRQPSLAAVRTLVQAWPDSVREWTGGDSTVHQEEDEEARLPIHLACQYGASLAVVQYLAQQDPTCLQAVSPHKMYTALDFSLYYYHHRRQQGLDVTEAERVVSFLANARVQDAPEHWNDGKKQQRKAAAAEPLPAVRARPVMMQPQQPPRETKPHAAPLMMRRSYPSYAPSPITSRPSYNNNNNNNKTSGKSSKIIRLSTLRPAVPLR